LLLGLLQIIINDEKVVKRDFPEFVATLLQPPLQFLRLQVAPVLEAARQLFQSGGENKD
jgi:hypothetical protein